MKRLFLIIASLASVLAAGTGLKAQEVTITLMPGWTWISIPSSETMDFATALGSFTPAVGDRIKSQWGNATYRGNGEWRGQISEFYPGYGYMYYSTRQVPVSVTFNAQQPTQQVVVTTDTPQFITAISAMGGGEVTTTDGTYIIVKGLCWATHENPTTNDDFYEEAESGVGTFSISMTELNIATTYYVRAYAVTSNGTVYGDQKTFTTRDGIPTVTTAEVTDIQGEKATCGGNVTDNCGLNVTARGVCWSTSQNPTVTDSHTTNGSGIGNFTSSITGLTISTTYYVRAYATTATGTGYGEQITFTTRDGIPTLTTADITNITGTSVTCGGIITDNGGLFITARGICWGTSPNPTIAGSHVANGSVGIGSYSCSITGLNVSTTYYVRAYATTAAGVSYGDQKTFTTSYDTSQVWVDLGLPSGLLWANCNLGADSPEEDGDYFAWGETQPKDYFDWNSYHYYVYYNPEGDYITKYWCDSYDHGEFDNMTQLLPSDDAAFVNWGEDWRMPTSEDWQELVQNTSFSMTTQNGIYGGLFIAPNGNSIFLPAVGYRDGSSIINEVGEGFYWSSSLFTNNSFAARNLRFGDGYLCVEHGLRYKGYSIRAVRSALQNDAPIGAIDGLFSVSDTQQVYFSQGNLQYQASSNTWRFADDQYEYIGSNNTNISQNNNDWIDLFGWGTSGYNHGAVCYQPWSTSQTNSNYYAYGDYVYNLFNQTGKADWGYNPISNGGNTTNQWRTLTQPEWDYVFNTRSTMSGVRYANANVNGNNGLILLPDNWSTSTYDLNNPNNSGANYGSNVITAAQWEVLEQAGAVFLPAGGFRSLNNGEVSVSWAGIRGYYWSATHYSNITACYVGFFNNLNTNSGNNRSFGFSVRLAKNKAININASQYPVMGGVVSGGGVYEPNASCTLTANANAGYTFVNWKENGEVVSTDPVYSFIAQENRNLVAYFSSLNGCLPGSFSVSENAQVCFSKGNLQYQASSSTWQFAEHQYDYVGNANSNISQTYSGWIDLFGWGTSGWDNGNTYYQPWSSANSYESSTLYGPPGDYDLTGIYANADWGVYNSIINGGNQPNQWRTLIDDEWYYIFYMRNTPSGIRFALANVNGVNGMILLPDEWSNSTFCLNNQNSIYVSFNGNALSVSQWSVLEQAGAVFLPAAGERDGTSVLDVGSYGSYWSASNGLIYGGCSADNLEFGNGFLYPYGAVDENRFYGRSVRLVRSVQ